MAEETKRRTAEPGHVGVPELSVIRLGGEPFCSVMPPELGMLPVGPMLAELLNELFELREAQTTERGRMGHKELTDNQIAARCIRHMKPKGRARLGKSLAMVCREQGWDEKAVRWRLERSGNTDRVITAKYRSQHSAPAQEQPQ
jgi:hypothetical protein